MTRRSARRSLGKTLERGAALLPRCHAPWRSRFACALSKASPGRRRRGGDREFGQSESLGASPVRRATRGPAWMAWRPWPSGRDPACSLPTAFRMAEVGWRDARRRRELGWSASLPRPAPPGARCFLVRGAEAEDHLAAFLATLACPWHARWSPIGVSDASSRPRRRAQGRALGGAGRGSDAESPGSAASHHAPNSRTSERRIEGAAPGLERRRRQGAEASSWAI